MKMHRLLGWLLLAAFKCFAQTSVESTVKPQLSPQSPNVAALGRFGEHPVSLYTGVPSINVPIYDISAGKVQVPVSLNYHAGGHRVTDVASWVGLGWALNAGGVITRTVIGRPDERDGILNRPLNLDLETYTGAGNNTSDANVCEQRQNELDNYTFRNYDTGYDIFSFSVPGKSGKFILVPDGKGSQVTTMPFERLKITYEREVHITKFTIIDEEGITYTFSEREALNADPNLGYYTSSWHLTSIQGTRPDDVVRFYYDYPPNYSGTTDFTDQISLLDQVSGVCSNSAGSGYSQTRTQIDMNLSSVILREIVFPGGKLEFNREGGPRSDLPGSRALDRIRLFGLNVNSNSFQLIKQFDLQQDYFAGGAGSLRLRAVALQNANDPAVTVGSYQFEYNTSQSMPGISSRSRDVWGYFNGKTNQTLIPQQTVPLYSVGGNSQTTIGDADRSTSEEHMQAWVLKKIIYPTGGSSQFFYEANRYNDNGVKLAGGLRVTRIETRASDGEPVKAKVYKYGVNEDGNGTLNVNLSMAFWRSYIVEKVAPDCEQRRVIFGSNSNANLIPFDGSPVTYEQVTEYEGTMSGTVFSTTNGKTVYTFEKGTDALYTAGGDMSKTYTASYHWERGQLLTKTVYNKDGGTLAKQVNTYARPVRTSVEKIGVLIAAPQRYTEGWYSYGDNRTRFPFPCDLLRYNYNVPVRYYPWPKGNLRLTGTQNYTYGSGGEVLTSTATTYNDDFQPKQQTTNASDGTSVTRVIRYPFDFSLPSNPDGFAKGLKILRDRNQLNTVIEEYSYKKSSPGDNNPKLVGGKLTTYQEFSSAFGYAFPKEIFGLEVSNGCCRLNEYAEASVNSGSFQKSSQYALELTYKDYNGQGDPWEYVMKDGLNTRFGWLYKNIMVSGNNSVLSVLESETANFGTDKSLTTRYEYDVPLIGVKAIKDPNDRATRFEYDAFARLKAIRDYKDNLVKSFDYNYANGERNPRSLNGETINPPASGITISDLNNIQNVPSGGGTNIGSFRVNSTNVNWTASNVPAWATLSTSSGGNGSTIVNVSFQSATQYREQIVTIGGAGGSATVTLSQQGTTGGGGGGNGLTGNYYNNTDLSGSPVLTRTDPQINFLWGDGGPGGGVNADNFSVRWTGQVEAPVSGTYTFRTNNDDGTRLWVNGVQLINDWNGHPQQWQQGSINLQAGQKYDIRMEYFDGGYLAAALLYWEYPGQPEQLIPSNRLFAGGGGSSLSVSNQGNVQNVTSGGGNFSFTVNSNVSWSISGAPSWASVSPTSGGNGANTVNVTFQANTSTSVRSATLTVSGGGLSQNVTLSQQGTTGGGGSCAITQVRIYPRTDCCNGRTIGAQIQVSTVGRNGPWQTIFTVPSENANAWNTFNISGASGDYKAIRFLSPTGGYGNVAEVEFYNGTTKLTGTLFDDGSGAWNGLQERASDKAMDGNTQTYYDANNCCSAFVGIEPTNCGGTTSGGCVVNKARLKFRPDCCFDRLQGARIEGSNDNQNWATLYTFNQNGNGQWQEFLFGNATAYQRVRFVAGPNGYGELYELEFYNNATKLSGTFFGSSGQASPGEGSQNALDGNEGTFWHGSFPGSSNFAGLQLSGCGGGGASLSVSNGGNIQDVVAGGGMFAFTVNSTNVNWSISGAPSWASVSPTSGGNGANTVNVTFQANTSTSVRSATLTVSGGGLSQNVTISQLGSGGSNCVVNKVRLQFRSPSEGYMERLVGAKIQGSNDNQNWTDLYTFNQNGTGSWQEFTFGNATSYQYVRFLAGPSGYGELNELEFYNGSTRLTGTTFGTAGTVSNNGYQAAFDGNTGTQWHGFFPGSGNYAGVQLPGCP